MQIKSKTKPDIRTYNVNTRKRKHYKNKTEEEKIIERRVIKKIIRVTQIKSIKRYLFIASRYKAEWQK